MATTKSVPRQSLEDVKRALAITAKNARWAWDEAVIDQKMQEANRLCSGSINDEYRYLLEKFGNGRAVLAAVEDMMSFKRPLKSLSRNQR